MLVLQFASFVLFCCLRACLALRGSWLKLRAFCAVFFTFLGPSLALLPPPSTLLLLQPSLCIFTLAPYFFLPSFPSYSSKHCISGVLLYKPSIFLRSFHIIGSMTSSSSFRSGLEPPRLSTDTYKPPFLGQNNSPMYISYTYYPMHILNSIRSSLLLNRLSKTEYGSYATHTTDYGLHLGKLGRSALLCLGRRLSLLLDWDFFCVVVWRVVVRELAQLVWCQNKKFWTRMFCASLCYVSVRNMDFKLSATLNSPLDSGTQVACSTDLHSSLGSLSQTRILPHLLARLLGSSILPY